MTNCGLCKKKPKSGDLHKIFIPPSEDSDECDTSAFTLCCEKCRPCNCVLCDKVTGYGPRYKICENKYACSACVAKLVNEAAEHTHDDLVAITHLVIQKLLDTGRSSVSDIINTRLALDRK